VPATTLKIIKSIIRKAFNLVTGNRVGTLQSLLKNEDY